MTEIPEHLRKRARLARNKAGTENQPDMTLRSDPGLSIRLSVVESTGVGNELWSWQALDLSTPGKRQLFADHCVAIASAVIRNYNKDQLTATEVDVTGIAQSINASPDEVAEALAAIRNTKL